MQCFEKSKVVKRNSVFLTLTKCRYQVRYVTKLSVVAVNILKNWSKDRVHSCLGCVYSRVMNSVVGGLGHTKEAFVSCLRQNLGDLLWSDYKQPFRLGYLLHRISLRRLMCPGLNQTSRSWREELYSCFLIKSNKLLYCFYCCVICLRLKHEKNALSTKTCLINIIAFHQNEKQQFVIYSHHVAIFIHRCDLVTALRIKLNWQWNDHWSYRSVCARWGEGGGATAFHLVALRLSMIAPVWAFLLKIKLFYIRIGRLALLLFL